MFKKEMDILMEISGKLSVNRTVQKVIAYGSRVRGDFREDSDLDVLVVVDKRDRGVRDMILDTFYPYELEAGIPFSIAVLSQKEVEFNERLGSPYIKSVKEEGMVLYDSKWGRKEDAL